MELISVLLACIGFLACPWLIGRTRFISSLNPSVSPKKISVIITSHNDAANLRRLIPDLYARSKVATQIIVADMGSADDSASIAKGLGCETVTINPASSSYSSLKAKILAAKKADSDILVFMNANICIAKNALNRILTAIKSCDAVSIYPKFTAKKAALSFTYIRNIALYAASGVFSFTPKKRPALCSALFAVKKDIFEKLISRNQHDLCFFEGLYIAACFKRSKVRIKNYMGGDEFYFSDDKFTDELSLSCSHKIISEPARLNGYSLIALCLLAAGGICIFINMILAIISSEAAALWICLYVMFAAINFKFVKAIASYPVYTYIFYPICILHFFTEASLLIRKRRSRAKAKVKIKAKANI